MSDKSNPAGRSIVVPGDVLDETGEKKPGNYTRRQGDNIIATRLGLLRERGGILNIIPLSGVYNPRGGDLVVGVVKQVGPSNWLVDINGPYPAPMHSSETPWNVEFGEASEFLVADDAILCKVLFVDEVKKVQVTMKDSNLRKLEGGHILEVSPSKVARVIGSKGSMINTIKRFTDVWMFVGQNGRIWVNGEPDMILAAVDAIRLIENEAHLPGLTEKVEDFLRERTGNTGEEPAEEIEAEAN